MDPSWDMTKNRLPSKKIPSVYRDEKHKKLCDRIPMSEPITFEQPRFAWTNKEYFMFFSVISLLFTTSSDALE